MLLGEKLSESGDYRRCTTSSGGNTAVVTTPYYDGAIGVNSGRLQVYAYDGTRWNQLGTDIDGESAGDQSRWSVSMSSDETIVATRAWYNAGENKLAIADTYGYTLFLRVNRLKWVWTSTVKM